MTPTLLLVVFSVVAIALFLSGAAMMVNRQEGGSARRPALLMLAGLAVLVLGMLSGLMLAWSRTPSPDAPHYELPGTSPR